jgi:hypothetical protein
MRWRRESSEAEPPLVKIRFELEPDDDGWPPVGGESLWAFDLGQDRYRLDNTPWFVRGVACYDVVEAVAPNADSVPVVSRVVEHSGHLTVRVLPLDDHGVDVLATLIEEFNALGVDCEGDQHHGLLALDIPPSTLLAPIKEYLDSGEANGRWEYEEGLVNEFWLAL